MLELSATVTSGEGSEKHNHDIGYRSKKLKHTHDTSVDTVRELVPYKKSYQDQINELMKPYIEKYNKSREEKYKKAWKKFEKGEIKNKPKSKDYKPMDYDYYTYLLEKETKNKKTGKFEKKPVFRSLILGIGDKHDKEKISREQAERLFTAITKRFEEAFPDFKIIGATLHADEDGFWHMHLDFFVLSQKKGNFKGLSVTNSLDTALENLGYKPEQSIINGRDKVPILFNAMRNQIYHIMEEEMRKEDMYLQYGVSAKKEPNKDSSRNQKLEIWQATQDAARTIQHLKNELNAEMDKKKDDPLSEFELENALKAKDTLLNAIESVQSSKHSRLDKSKVLVEFSLFDQIKSFLEGIKKTLEAFVSKIGQLQATIAEKDKIIEEKDETIKEKDEKIKDNQRIIQKAFKQAREYAQKEMDGKYYTNEEIQKQNEQLKQKDQQIEILNKYLDNADQLNRETLKYIDWKGDLQYFADINNYEIDELLDLLPDNQLNFDHEKEEMIEK